MLVFSRRLRRVFSTIASPRLAPLRILHKLPCTVLAMLDAAEKMVVTLQRFRDKLLPAQIPHGITHPGAQRSLLVALTTFHGAGPRAAARTAVFRRLIAGGVSVVYEKRMTYIQIQKVDQIGQIQLLWNGASKHRENPSNGTRIGRQD
jgi:hypothetical protein